MRVFLWCGQLGSRGCFVHCANTQITFNQELRLLLVTSLRFVDFHGV